MPILGFLGLSVLELCRCTRQTDIQTDRHRPSFHNGPTYGGRDKNNTDRFQQAIVVSATVFDIDSMWSVMMPGDVEFRRVRVVTECAYSAGVTGVKLSAVSSVTLEPRSVCQVTVTSIYYTTTALCHETSRLEHSVPRLYNLRTTII